MALKCTVYIISDLDVSKINLVKALASLLELCRSGRVSKIFEEDPLINAVITKLFVKPPRLQ